MRYPHSTVDLFFLFLKSGRREGHTFRMSVNEITFTSALKNSMKCLEQKRQILCAASRSRALAVF